MRALRRRRVRRAQRRRSARARAWRRDTARPRDHVRAVRGGDVRAAGDAADDRRGPALHARDRRRACAGARCAFAGRHNVTNALGAAGAGLALGLGLEEIARGLADARPVEGPLRVAPGRRRPDPRRHLQRQPGLGARGVRHGGRASRPAPARRRARRHARARRHDGAGAPRVRAPGRRGRRGRVHRHGPPRRDRRGGGAGSRAVRAPCTRRRSRTRWRTCSSGWRPATWCS